MRPHGHSKYQQLMEKPGLDSHGVLVLQGRPPAPDKKEDGVRPKPFFCFSLSFSHLFTFTTGCNPSLPL
jgi:hypothetical protein